MAVTDPLGPVARRQGVDPRGVRSDVSDTGSRERFELIRIEALRGQDRPLVAGPAEGILAERPVAPDDAVTRDDERDRVVAKRGPDGPNRLRPADLGGDPAVRPDLAAGDLEGLEPDGPLELRRPAKVEVDPGPAIAGQTPLDGPGEALWQRVATLRTAAGPGGPKRADRRIDQRVVIGEPDRDERVVGQVGRRRFGQCGDRRLDRREVDRRPRRRGRLSVHAVNSSRSCRWLARNASRSVARPRWTWALSVPSGRPSAAAISAYDRPSTCRRTIAVRCGAGRPRSSDAQASRTSRAASGSIAGSVLGSKTSSVVRTRWTRVRLRQTLTTIVASQPRSRRSRIRVAS